MKKKIIGVAIIAAMAVTVGWNFSQNKKAMPLSDLMLANVEALAGGESTTDPNLGKGVKKVNCTKNGVITGTKCDTGSPTDECHYKRDVTGKCE